MKSEPGTWSWQDQLDVGEEGTHWDGVRNYQASNFMKQMQLGDQCFFYHSVKEKQIVGIVEVIRLYEPDPTDESGRFGQVWVKAILSFPQPVHLSTIKATPALSDMALIRQSRLSVQPVEPDAWRVILALGGF